MTADVLVNALDAVSDAVLVCDRQGAVMLANRAARDLFSSGVPPSRADLLRHPVGAKAKEHQLAAGVVVVIPRASAPLSLAERERLAIEQALGETSWQLAIAARRLGISRTTLWRRLKQYGMQRPGPVHARA